jgi:hypothetical protein
MDKIGASFEEKEVENGSNIKNLEGKIRTVGNQTRWWGTIVFIVGVVMAIWGVSGGIVITALGVVVALQGAIIQYAFRTQRNEN